MSPGGDSATILAVDDLPDYLDLYEQRLGDEYEVVTASDGETAIELGDGDVDVVLLDREMPGMSGDEVLAALKAEDVDCRVAMVTANEPDEDVVDLGYDTYLTKPVSGAELSDAVERLLRLSEYVDAVAAFHDACERRTERLADGENEPVLSDEIRDHRERVDELASGFSDEDYRVVFRDLD